MGAMLLCGTLSFAQSDDPVIMTVNGHPVLRSEFAYSYKKNNTNGVLDRKSVRDYVPLFINYKLKVEAAKDAHLDTLSSYKKEFAGYRDQQIRPAMIDSADIEAEARKIYEEARQRIDGNGGMVRVSHILIAMKQKATPDEEKVAKQRIDSVYNALQHGADFAALARKVSQDPGSAGEGGQLPGFKVNEVIAKTRHSIPGISLISPPPHHDIYSIEDLAQLIHDLKNANRDARISVKLVSEAGVGTIAAGVAKAGAEVILISGFDGGTGAAPRNSIHNAGLPWELGLAEAHQSLIMNGLRSRVRIEADSKLMSGRDVAIAAMLGAEEFGFGTGPLVAMGCVMMRVCNLDTCPMGICTQNPELRKRFKGKPEYIINFMRFMAEDLREYMARLGVHTVDELVGRTDLLKVKDAPAGSRASEMDLTALLKNPLVENSSVHFNAKDVYNFGLEKTPDMRVLMKKFKKSFDMAEPKPMTVELEVGNTDRAFGTIFGSEITRKFGNTLPEDTFHVICNGYGGQSFGAFIPAGLTLELVGDSNDYMGKGLSGGRLIVYPPKDVTYDRSENIVIGNVALYGATAGKAFINGVAGERFCVRNSGATAVVEGVGDHGCEYMTGGTVVVLGKTGKNFAAGMSGGIAYVLDSDHELYLRLNKQMVTISAVTERHDAAELRQIIEAHVRETGSAFGKEILEHFPEYLPKFKKIIPMDYQKMISTIGQMEEKGMDHEQATMEAFYRVSKEA